MTTTKQETGFTAQHAGFTYGHCDKCRQAPANYYVTINEDTEIDLCEFCTNEDYPNAVAR